MREYITIRIEVIEVELLYFSLKVKIIVTKRERT